MKTRHSKIKIFFIALTSIFVLMIASIQVSVKTLNHFKGGFYFEKYSSAEEAKGVLLKMHPIGSDVNALVETLKKAGAKITDERDDRGEYLFYVYHQKGFFTPYKWGGAIVHDTSDNIITYGMGMEYRGL